jgi:hypothetical protein
MNPSLPTHRLRAALLGALLLCGGTLAQAQPTSGGRAQTIGRDSTVERVVRIVYQGQFSFVRIERAEPNAAPSQHPMVVTDGVLRAALAPLRNARVKDEPLFNDEELAEIVPPLVRALGEVKPDQDVAFAVAGRHSGWVALVPRSVTTGRLFRSADGLQLIVGLVQEPFESQFLATGYLRPFESGRRAAPFDKNVAIASATGVARRSDWVTVALAAEPPAPAVAATPAPAQASAAAVPATAAAPPAAAAAPSTPRDPAFLEEQERRLATLKRLRERGLITEEEYQQKRREVLSQL